MQNVLDHASDRSPRLTGKRGKNMINIQRSVLPQTATPFVPFTSAKVKAIWFVVLRSRSRVWRYFTFCTLSRSHAKLPVSDWSSRRRSQREIKRPPCVLMLSAACVTFCRLPGSGCLATVAVASVVHVAECWNAAAWTWLAVARPPDASP